MLIYDALHFLIFYSLSAIIPPS